MNLYTFENTNRKATGDGNLLYDLFEKTMVNNYSLRYSTYIVPDQYDSRLDLVCRHIYGNINYMEELMTQNNIINPFSIKSGDKLYYSYSPTQLSILYQSDLDINKENKNRILNVNKNKSTKKDPNSQLPPSIKPDSIKQLDINYNKKKITVINKFR